MLLPVNNIKNQRQHLCQAIASTFLPNFCQGGHHHQAIYCGELPTPLVDGQTSRVYCITLVQYLYISCYVFSNKLVLSYLSLCLLLQW